MILIFFFLKKNKTSGKKHFQATFSWTNEGEQSIFFHDCHENEISQVKSF